MRAVVFFGVLDDFVRAFDAAGLADAVEWSDRIWFRDGSGPPFSIRPAPPPGALRFAPDLSRFRALSPAERLAAARVLARIVRGKALPPPGARLGPWLRDSGAAPRVVDRLLRPLVEVAFDRPLERVDARAGTEWLRAFFSRSGRSARIGVLRVG